MFARLIVICATLILVFSSLPIPINAAGLPGTIAPGDVGNSVAGAVFLGIDDDDHAGYEVTDAGDVDGDGIDDILITAIDADPLGVDRAAEVYLIYGQSGGSAFSGDVNLSDVGTTVAGATLQGVYTRGGATTSAGDVNGDGLSDILIGAHKAGPGGLINAGEAYLVYGRRFDNSPLTGDIYLWNVGASVGGVKIQGASSHSEVGYRVSIPGDVNDDTYAEIMLTADGWDKMYLIWGSNTLASTISVADIGQPGGVLGITYTDFDNSHVSGAGDMNGDGIDDLLMSRRATSGFDVYLGYGEAGTYFSGTVGPGDLTGPRLTGVSGGGHVAAAGDFNGDGVDDILVDYGYLVFGQSGAAEITGVIPLAEIGSSLEGVYFAAGRAEGAGDINQDGIDDLWVQAGNPSKTYLVYGFPEAPPRSIPLDRVGVTVEGVVFGTLKGVVSVSRAGDFNDDGIDDYMVGRSEDNDNTSATERGMTYVIYGVVGPTPTAPIGQTNLYDIGDTTPGVVFNGILANNEAGVDVSDAGDFNGDGVDDVLIRTEADQVYVIYGQSGASALSGTIELADLATTLAGVYFNGVTSSICAAGDFNGDGVDDVCIGYKLASVTGPETGSAYIVYGQMGGAALSGSVDLSDVGTSVAGVVLNGALPYDHAGDAVARAGDFNGDGVDDVMISSPDADPGSLDKAGQIAVVYGQIGGSELNGSYTLSNIGGTLAGAVFNGTKARNGEEMRVSTAGDFNGDGTDEILIGAWHAPSGSGFDEGSVYLVYGRSGGSAYSGAVELSDIGGAVDGLSLTGASSYCGYSVSEAGDVNGDGLSDILFGTFGYSTYFSGGWDWVNAGQTYLIYGRPVTEQLSGAYSVNAIEFESSPIALTGAILRDNRDINKSGSTSFPPGSGELGGAAVSSVGDFDGDGIDDFLVGAPGALGSFGGEVKLFRGRDGAFFLRGTHKYGEVGEMPYQGYQAGDEVGYAISEAGDFNGDGLDDFLIGAYGSDVNGTDSGRVYVVYGREDVAAPVDTVPDPQSGTTLLGINNGGLGATFTTSSGEASGWHVSNAGDINGDGVDDILIGAKNLQRVYLIYGQDAAAVLSGDVDLADVGTTVSGFVVQGVLDVLDNIGIPLSDAGDFNGDGVADLIIGAVTANSGWGQAIVIYGQTGGSALSGAFNVSDVGSTVAGAVFNGVASNDDTGRSVSSAGDVNNDSVDDILIGAPGSVGGKAYLIYGQSGGSALSGTYLISDVGTTVAGAVFQHSSGDQVGQTVSDAGDFNGDGIDDFIIGAPAQDVGSMIYVGRAFLIYGKSGGSALSGTYQLTDIGGSLHGITFDGASAKDYTGAALSDAGDINGDGVADILIGAPSPDGLASPFPNLGPPETYLIYGQTGSSELSGTIDLADVGTTVAGVLFTGGLRTLAGTSVAGGGDVNSDGIDDLVIGAPSDDTSSGYYNGRAYVVYGKSAPALSGTIDLFDVGDTVEGVYLYTVLETTLNGNHYRDSVGRSVTMGDFNGDGAFDVVVGASGTDTPVAGAGATYLVYGRRVDFASALFSTHTLYDASHSGRDITWIRIHNNNASSATASFIFKPRWGDPAVSIVSSAVSLQAGETTLVNLEADLGVERERWGAFTLQITGVDPSYITIDEVVQTVAGPQDGLYVPVRPLASKPIGSVFTTMGNDETYLELFNSDDLPIALTIDFYAASSDTIITTYNVTVPAQTLELVSLEAATFGYGTFTAGRPAEAIGFFKISSGGSAPPPELVANAHIARSNFTDFVVVEMQQPNSGSGLVAPLFRITRDSGGIAYIDTWVGLVNTGPSAVTAHFAFSSGVSGSVSDVVLAPNTMEMLLLSTTGVAPAAGATTEGAYTLTFTGTDTTQVSVASCLLVHPYQDSVHIPVRASATGNVGAYYKTDGGVETHLMLYNTDSLAITADIMFTRASDLVQETYQRVLQSNEGVRIECSTVQSTTTGEGWFTISYTGGSGLGTVQTSAVYNNGGDYRWVDVQDAAVGP